MQVLELNEKTILEFLETRIISHDHNIYERATSGSEFSQVLGKQGELSNEFPRKESECFKDWIRK